MKTLIFYTHTNTPYKLLMYEWGKNAKKWFNELQKKINK